MRARRRSSKLLCLGGAELNDFAHDSLLDARVKHQDLKAAEDIMDQTRQAGMTDVVSFNSLIKAHLQRGQLAKGVRVDRRYEEGRPAAEPEKLQ